MRQVIVFWKLSMSENNSSVTLKYVCGNIEVERCTCPMGKVPWSVDDS